MYRTVRTSMAGGVAGTDIDCQKQVRSWRLLRSLAELLIPTCNCTSIQEHEITYYSPQPSSNVNITGTIFGFRHGKVSLCIQTSIKYSTTPLLLLELAVPTTILAKEMSGGILRIALECTTVDENVNNCYSLLSMPVWTMYCNGRKVGFAVKRHPSKADMEVLRVLERVIVGAGVISSNELDCEEDMMYLRGNFERVRGASESESFHLIDPDGSISQQLSIFFIRPRC